MALLSPPKSSASPCVNQAIGMGFEQVRLPSAVCRPSGSLSGCLSVYLSPFLARRGSTACLSFRPPRLFLPFPALSPRARFSKCFFSHFFVVFPPLSVSALLDMGVFPLFGVDVLLVFCFQPFSIDKRFKPKHRSLCCRTACFCSFSFEGGGGRTFILEESRRTRRSICACSPPPS